VRAVSGSEIGSVPRLAPSRRLAQHRGAHHKTGAKLGAVSYCREVIERRPALLLQLKLLLRDVHPAVWRRVKLADSLSIADLHRVIQLLMGWDDDHLHRFRIHGRDCGIAYVGGPNFDEDAAALRLAEFGFRPTERFLYEYDFAAGWQIEVRVEKVIGEAPWERRCDAVSWDMATDMDAVAAVLRRVADGDDDVLADPETFSDFKRDRPKHGGGTKPAGRHDRPAVDPSPGLASCSPQGLRRSRYKGASNHDPDRAI